MRTFQTLLLYQTTGWCTQFVANDMSSDSDGVSDRRLQIGKVLTICNTLSQTTPASVVHSADFSFIISSNPMPRTNVSSKQQSCLDSESGCIQYNYYTTSTCEELRPQSSNKKTMYPHINPKPPRIMCWKSQIMMVSQKSDCVAGVWADGRDNFDGRNLG